MSLRLRAAAGARYVARRRPAPRPRHARSLPLRPGACRASRAAARLPARGAAAHAAAAARHAAVRGRRGRAPARRRDRVRGHPPVRVRRPGDARQLARDGAARRALGERPPSGAEHGRRALPRHVHGGAAAASPSTLDLALRAAATLARAYVGTRDRVGLVSFGGSLRWLKPGTGETQLYRICEALLDTQILLSYAWRDIAVVPARVLPPQSLVIALTPLLDERMLGALFDLRARGHDLMVIEASPRAVRRAGRAPPGPARLPALEAATRRAARPPAAGRRGGRRMARGHASGCRNRGGGRIQAPRIRRPRLKLRRPRPRWARLLRAGGALACAAALVVYPALETPRLAWLLWMIAAVALLDARRRPRLAPHTALPLGAGRHRRPVRVLARDRHARARPARTGRRRGAAADRGARLRLARAGARPARRRPPRSHD